MATTKMIKNIFLLGIVFVVVLACQKKSPTRKLSRFYNINIEYLYQGLSVIEEDRYRYKISSDTLYLVFEGWFNSDTVDVITTSLISSHVITTDPSTGIAKVLKYSNLSNMNTISLSLNSGPLLTLENVPKFNIIGLKFSDSTLTALYYKKVPIYD